MVAIQTSNVIDDGYTRRAYIKPDEHGLHSGLLIEYRPMTAEQAEDLDHCLSKVEGGKAIRLMVAAITKQLVSWSEVDEKSKVERPVTQENVARMPRLLLVSLRQLVQGLWLGDLVPEPTSQEATDYAQGLMAVVDGKAPGPEQLEADRKN